MPCCVSFIFLLFLIVKKHWQIQRSKWTKQVGWVGQSTSFFCWYWRCLKWFSSWLKQQRSSRCRGLARCWMFEWQGCRLHHGALRPSSVIAVLRIDCPLFCPPPGVIIIILSLTEPLPEIQNINCVCSPHTLTATTWWTKRSDVGVQQFKTRIDVGFHSFDWNFWRWIFAGKKGFTPKV